MGKIHIILLVNLVFLIASCRHPNNIPVEVDPDLGSCRIHFSGHPAGTAEVRVNGKNVFEGVRVFHENDSLVAINSLGGIDVLAIFKGDSTRVSVQLVLINPGEENQGVNAVEIFYTGHDGFCAFSDPGAHWSYLSESSGDSLIRALDISGSSIVLLTEERLSLPPLEFFLSSLS